MLQPPMRITKTPSKFDIGLKANWNLNHIRKIKAKENFESR